MCAERTVNASVRRRNARARSPHHAASGSGAAGGAPRDRQPRLLNPDNAHAKRGDVCRRWLRAAAGVAAVHQRIPPGHRTPPRRAQRSRTGSDDGAVHRHHLVHGVHGVHEVRAVHGVGTRGTARAVLIPGADEDVAAAAGRVRRRTSWDGADGAVPVIRRADRRWGGGRAGSASVEAALRPCRWSAGYWFVVVGWPSGRWCVCAASRRTCRRQHRRYRRPTTTTAWPAEPPRRQRRNRRRRRPQRRCRPRPGRWRLHDSR